LALFELSFTVNTQYKLHATRFRVGDDNFLYTSKRRPCLFPCDRSGSVFLVRGAVELLTK